MAKTRDVEGAEADPAAKGGKRKLMLIAIILPALLLLGGGLYFFVFASDSGTTTSAGKRGGGTATEAKPTEVPGAVVTVDPITINLAGGHYLKVGLALQATADAGEEVPPGKAADALISQFSGKTVDELATEQGRETAKTELLKAIKKAYEKKIYEIYYTTFVMN